jgi:membrane fusion protein (multidrug efflux system)
MSRGLYVGCLALLVACNRSGDDTGESSSHSSSLSSTRVPVGLATVTRDSIRDLVVVSGRLSPKPGGSALLTAPAAGVVREVRAQVGARVRRGDELVLLDVPELASDARQKEAAAAQAQRQAEREAGLLRDGVTSKRAAEEAAAAARQATSAAEAAQTLLARTTVRAPLSGRVQTVRVQRGERVEAGTPLAEVIDADTLDVHAAVPAQRLHGLRARQPVSVVQEGDTTQHPAILWAIAPGVDSLTNAGEVVIRVPNPDGRLLAGAGATARIVLGMDPQALLVPDSALVLAGDSNAVFVMGADSIVHQRIVTPGVRQGSRVQVEGKLSPGERVVTTGAFGLQDGMRVEPK